MKGKLPAIKIPAGARKSGRRPQAFTLIEVLTVIAIIAVLISLSLTALMSAKKKSRAVVCINNLRQFNLALIMYLDDQQVRPTLQDLVSGNYVPPGSSLKCPEDKTTDWGQLLLSPPQNLLTATNFATNGITSSYLSHPLVWDISLWNRLIQSGGSQGVVACQLHGLGNQNTSDVHNYSGFLLRAQLDGSVARHELFWDSSATNTPIPGVPASTNTPYLYPLPIYMNDPAQWILENP